MSVAMAEISCSARRMILLLFSLQSMTGFCCFIIDPPVRTHPGRWLLHGTEEPFQERDGCRHRIEGPVYDGIPDDPENHFPQIFAIAHIEEDANGELRQAATTPETVMSLPTRRCVRLMRLMTLAYSAVWILRAASCDCGRAGCRSRRRRAGIRTLTFGCSLSFGGFLLCPFSLRH